MSQLKNKTTAFIDRDGTLLGTCFANFEAYSTSFSKCGIKPPENLFESIHQGLHISEILSNSHIKLTSEAYLELRSKKAEYFQDNWKSITPNLEVYELITQFPKKIIVTNSSIESTEFLFSKFFVHELSKVQVISPFGTLRPKPFPDLYITAIEESGAPINQILVFEDSEHGLTAAAKAGLDCMQINHIC